MFVGVVDCARSMVGRASFCSARLESWDSTDELIVESESCEVERPGDVASLPRDASLPNGRYALRTRVLLLEAFFSFSSFPIFFSTSAKTASIDIPSKRMDGIRGRECIPCSPSEYTNSFIDWPMSS